MSYRGGRGGRNHDSFKKHFNFGKSHRNDSGDGPFRRGRGRPPGLRGKEIGLYYRDLQRNRNKYNKIPLISLDQKRKQHIKSLLESISKSSHVTTKIKSEQWNSNAGCSSDFVDSETKQDSLGGLDMESNNIDNSSILQKYKHVGESKFKRKFLLSITGSIEEKLESCQFLKMERDPVLDNSLKEELLDKQHNSAYKKMQEFRMKLPAYQKQSEIINVINNHQVVLISGETGCGKTTQVGQFILDHIIEKGDGSLAHIVCTQPRRISAIAMAQRVADERAETCGEKSVGYQIRLEKQFPRMKGSILYCTTGIILEWMQSDPALSRVSHLILDEIHERDTVSDFILALMKNVIPKRPDMKLILMSATLNAEHFSKYYDDCPNIHIPGFTFPVKEFYLEDVLEMTGFQFPEAPQSQGNSWRKHCRKNKEREKEYQDFIDPFIRHLKSEKKYSPSVLQSLKNRASEDLNIDLVAQLVRHICFHEEDGAILVFLPGWDDISKLHKILTEKNMIPLAKCKVLPLHSMMPTGSQRQIFDRPPTGIRKIVIATNIAETSITIDDIVYVIDCGKIKMSNFDVENNISTLKAEWVSLANARQRRGRAGRVQPGKCYHLFTRAREMILESYPVPELLRTRLEEVILKAKILQLGYVRPFLQKVMDPPDPKAVDLSVELLQRLNALDDDEKLTPLGFHLANLPLDPQTGKMILMGAMFSCIDPIFSIAASLNFKDAFVTPLGQESNVMRKKRELAGRSKSDHILLAEALRKWEIAEKQRNGRDFSWEYYLSPNTLKLLRDMKQQFAEHLHRMNFLNSGDPKDPSANINSKNSSLVRAIICAGLYPNIAIVTSVKYQKGMNKFSVKLSIPKHGKVEIHPRSINESEREFESPILVYYMKLKSSSIYLHDTTMVHPLPVVFFGKDLTYSLDGDQREINVNENLKFRCDESTALIIKELTKKLDELLEYKISHPGVINWSHESYEGCILRAIIELVTYEDNQLMVDQGNQDFEDSHDDDDDGCDNKSNIY